MDTNTAACTCRAYGCDVRIARGLTPFCQMPAPARRPQEGFDTYREAVAAMTPGTHIHCVGGLGTGSPSRFVLVTVGR